MHSSKSAGPFIQGCIDAIPICISLVFLFFSCGSLCTTYGFRPVQAVSMTALIFASPLQVFIAEHWETISFESLALATLFINFRFLIMSSALSEKLKDISVLKLLASVPMLATSTFMLANEKGRSGDALFRYYLGVGLSGLGTALAGTTAGAILASTTSSHVTSLVNMILPAHFTILTGLLWPKTRPVLATILSFLISPIAGFGVGRSSVIVVPLVVAVVFVTWAEQRTREST